MKSTALLMLGTLFFVSCSDDDSDPHPAPSNDKGVNVQIRFNVDGDSLRLDTVMYTNAAGNHYSVGHLEFYLSDFHFYSSVKGIETVVDTVFYVNARKPETLTRLLLNVAPAPYDSCSFVIGVDSVHNIFGTLPSLSENINMEWPLSMGGGYHHMKMEGYFESGGSTVGYAMHLGTNGIQVHASNHFIIDVWPESGKGNMVLDMNINEWYQNPMIYDFNIDGNHSMGNMPAMMKLSANGADVFYP
jgi:hypothetical protein